MARIDDLLDKVDSKYTLVHLSAKRARDINDYYHSLGDGRGLYIRPLVECDSNKPLSIAFEEIAAGKIVVQPESAVKDIADSMFDSLLDDEDDEVVVQDQSDTDTQAESAPTEDA